MPALGVAERLTTSGHLLLSHHWQISPLQIPSLVRTLDPVGCALIPLDS